MDTRYVAIAVALLIPVAMLAAGCGGDDDDDSQSLTGAVWGWAAFDAEDGDDITVPDPSVYTLEFTNDEGSFNIQADCNTGSGQATIDGDNITIGEFILTLIFCGDESLDQDFTQLLGQVETFERDGDELTFNLADDAGEMTFEAQ